MLNDKLLKAKREAEDSPTAWFATLEIAIDANDFDRAAMAKRQLARLGVEVQFNLRKAVTHAAR